MIEGFTDTHTYHNEAVNGELSVSDDVRVFDVHEQKLDDGVRASQPGHPQ